MKTLVISDTHFNPKRQGGTTMESRYALEAWQFTMLKKTLQIPHDRLVINGDLFDKRTVSEKTMLKTVNLLKGETNVIINRGNHDENSERYGEICSLQLLGALLPNCTTIYDKPNTIQDMHFVPHCFNQEEFDKCVENVPKNVWVFIHANNDNGFTVEADHSLNLSRAQSTELVGKGCHIFLGHEHAADDSIMGMTILGCLTPTSVADCLAGDKYAWVIAGTEITKHLIWSTDDFAVIPWQDLEHTDHNFVRVVGECDLAEYPEIIRQVGALRKKSSAFIVANAVKPRVVDRDELNKEDVTNFNIIDLFLGQVSTEFRGDIEKCTD